MRHASGRRRRTLLASAVAALVVVAAAVAAWFLWSPGAGAARGVEVTPSLEPATLSVAPGERMSATYKYPLYLCMLGFFLLFVTLLLIRTRTEIRRRRTAALLAREVHA